MSNYIPQFSADLFIHAIIWMLFVKEFPGQTHHPVDSASWNLMSVIYAPDNFFLSY